MSGSRDLAFSSLASLRRKIRERRVGVEELARLYLERVRRYDGGPGGLCAVAELSPCALEEARRMDAASMDRERPLFGLPLLVKDNVDVAGLHTMAGSLALKDHRAREDAGVIANLRKNGALILGTNMTESGILPISHTLDSAGALGRTFSDALLVAAGMRDSAPRAVAPAQVRGGPAGAEPL